MSIQGIYENSPAKKLKLIFGLQRLMVLIGNKVLGGLNALIIDWRAMYTMFGIIIQ